MGHVCPSAAAAEGSAEAATGFCLQDQAVGQAPNSASLLQAVFFFFPPFEQ